MNKIIREYPVDLLPLDLREGLPEHGHVEIEIRSVSDVPTRPRLADLAGSIPNIHGTIEEAVNHIRKLRGSDN